VAKGVSLFFSNPNELKAQVLPSQI